MNQIAHNLSVKALIAALKEIKCEYVDAMVENESALVFRPSENIGNDEEDGEIDLEDTII
jgi:predicted nuclease with RNAse H fold